MKEPRNNKTSDLENYFHELMKSNVAFWNVKFLERLVSKPPDIKLRTGLHFVIKDRLDQAVLI